MEYTGERFIPGKVEGDIKIEHMHRYQCITEFIKDKIVLDAACGDGYGTDIIADNALKVYGIDISGEAVDVANNKYRKDNLEFLVASVETLPFSDASIDVIVSFETIEHVDAETQHKFLTEVKRVLKHEGIFIISTPDKRVYSDLPGYKNEYHQKEFYIDEFKDFLNFYFGYISMYNQSFKRINIINSLDNTNESYQNIIVQNNVKNALNTYVIAVCSRTEIKPIKNLQSLTYCNQSFQSSLYLDYGEGFSETNKITSELSYNGNDFIVDFKLPDMKSVKSLRWDPVEGKFCMLKIDKLLMENGNILVSSTNAEYKKDGIDGIDVFYTTDPIYIFAGDYKKSSLLVIEGTMNFVSSKEIYGYIYTTQTISNEIKNENTSLQDKINYLDISLKNTIEIKSNLQEKLNANLQEIHRLQEYRNMEQEKYGIVIKKIEDLDIKQNLLIDKIKQLEEKYIKIAEERLVLQKQLDISTSEKAMFIEQYNIILEKYGISENEKQELERKNDIIVKEKVEFGHKYDIIVKEKEEFRRKYDITVKGNEELEEHVKILTNEKKELQEKCKYLDEKVNEYDKKLHLVEAEKDEAKDELDKITGSTFWKLTKPFRKF